MNRFVSRFNHNLQEPIRLLRLKFDLLVAICGDGGVPRFTLPPSSQQELGRKQHD